MVKKRSLLFSLLLIGMLFTAGGVVSALQVVDPATGNVTSTSQVADPATGNVTSTSQVADPPAGNVTSTSQAADPPAGNVASTPQAAADPPAGGAASAPQAADTATDSPKDQKEEPFEKGEILSWLTSNPPEWKKGAIFASLGLVGALVTLFGLVGGVIPGTAGQARIEADNKRLEVMATRLDELIRDPASNSAMIEAVQKSVNELRDDLRSEKWSQFAIASFMYAFLGAAFAAILADTLLQAMVIGAGWTGMIGSLGLKKDHAERGAIKDDALQKAEQTIETIQQKGGAENVNLQGVYESIRVARAV